MGEGSVGLEAVSCHMKGLARKLSAAVRLLRGEPLRIPVL